MTAEDWFTIEKAARHLGVSTRTLRRWIKAGKLQARLEPGPYGQQYLVPRSGMAGVQMVRDVERAEREADRAALPHVLDEYLAQRESELAREMAALRAEMYHALARLEEGQARLLRQVEELRGELAAQPEHPDNVDPTGGSAP